MASIAQSQPAAGTGLEWLWEWLRDELTPYPGRAQVVTRMVIAATLLMIITMTFQIRYGFQGVVFALLISRENIRATFQSAAIILLVTLIGASYLIASAWFVINIPLLHFLWIIVSLFLAFYLISTMENYTAAVSFAVVLSIGIPTWDRLLPAETNLEDTLWLVLAVLLGSLITAAVEVVSAQLRPGSGVLTQIAERASAVENLLNCFAEGCAVDVATAARISRLATLGTSLLRRILRRSDHSLQYRTHMAGVASLIGRLVDLAATLTQLRLEPSATDRARFRDLASTLGRIRNDLLNRALPAPAQFERQSPGTVPLLDEMERTVTLIPEVLQGSRSVDMYLPSQAVRRQAIFTSDALANPDHLRFALKGCLAASGSYVLYNALAWPQISTAVTTCLLTAVSTIGASHQKQILRIAGTVAGGFVLGMGSQIFVLPYLDSIAGFTVLFVLITALSAWILTSSPRLSYFGFQAAIAFCLITLQEFKIQTSLSVARDRVVGVLLGLIMMWLAFDPLWGAPAALEMKRKFTSNLRLLAQFAREPGLYPLRIAVDRAYVLRDAINVGLDRVRDLADGVLFEFGPTRQRDLELRDCIRRWQPQLRTLFLMRIASLKYSLQLTGFELPERIRLRHQAYDEHSAHMLEEMAAWIEGNAADATDGVRESRELLEKTVEEIAAQKPVQLAPGRAASFLVVLRSIDGLTTSLASQIASDMRRIG